LQQYKDESEMLDRCARLHDTSSDYFDLEAKRISQVYSYLLYLYYRISLSLIFYF